MFALTLEGSALAWRERPDLEPGPGEVVVAVEAAGLNAADLLQRRGLYPAPPGAPEDVPGLELAGRVRRVGAGVSESLLDRPVCALVAGGAQATECVVAAEHLLDVPEPTDWAAAGGFPEAFSTALDALATQGRVSPGERVLVTGANGGVGTAAIQVARVLGATVVALARDPRHHEDLRELGASAAITLDQLADQDRFDVVVELVGAATLEPALGRLNPHARVVVIGVSGGGGRLALDLHRVMTQRTELTGSTMRSRSREEKADVADRVRAALTPRWAEGALRVPLAGVYDAREAEQAYEAFARPGKFGKIVLRVPDAP